MTEVDVRTVSQKADPKRQEWTVTRPSKKNDAGAKTTESFVNKKMPIPDVLLKSDGGRMQLGLLRPVGAIVRRLGRMQMRTFLTYAEHGIRCHGNASTDAEGK